MKPFLEKFKKLWSSKFATHLNDTIGQADIGIVFLLILGQTFTNIAKFCALPILLGTAAVGSILSVYRAHKEGKSNKLAIGDATVTVLTSLGIVAAIILTFIGQAALGPIAAYLLTGAVAIHGLYELAAGCYCWYKYLKLRYTNPAEAEKYYQQAKCYTIGFVTSALATGALAGVLIADQFAFGALGVASAALGTAYGSYRIYKTYKSYKEEQAAEQAAQNPTQLAQSVEPTEAYMLTNNATLHNTLGVGYPSQTPLPSAVTYVQTIETIPESSYQPQLFYMPPEIPEAHQGHLSRFIERFRR